ncbi:MAG: hypothetical protein ACREFF_00690 [Candidatus Udaeobacter sp.]
MNRIFLAGLLGGIAMFIWEYIAYTALPLGSTGIRKLPNEIAVLDALQKNIAENSGIYLFPWWEPNPPEKKAEATNNFGEKMARYPSGILMYNAAGSRLVTMSRWLFVEFLTELAQALLAVFLLSLTRLTTFRARLTFVLLVGVMAAIATNVTYWNWYGFSWNYTLASMFIQVVGFLCVGLVAAFILKKQTFGVASARSFWPRMWRAILGD